MQARIFIIATALLCSELNAHAKLKCQGSREELIKEIVVGSSNFFSKKFLTASAGIIAGNSALALPYVTKLPNAWVKGGATALIVSAPFMAAAAAYYQENDSDDPDILSNFLSNKKSMEAISDEQFKMLCETLNNVRKYHNFAVRGSYNDERLDSAKDWGRYCLPKTCHFLIYGSENDNNAPNAEKLNYDLSLDGRSVVSATLTIDAVLNDINPASNKKPYSENFCIKLRVNGSSVAEIRNLGLEHGMPYNPQPPKGYNNFRPVPLLLPPELLPFFQNGPNQIRFQLSCANGYLVSKSTHLVVLTAEKNK